MYEPKEQRPKRAWKHLAVILAAAFAVVILRPWSAGATPCPPKGSVIVVDTTAGVLTMCANGEARQTRRVAIGRGGAGKTRRGDNKSPLGDYRLGNPRPSKRFGTFIPLGYPTATQRKRGYTGSAVGVHGPDRRVRWAGPLNTLVNWTQGCIAVRSDDAVTQIAAWVKLHKVRLISLR